MPSYTGAEIAEEARNVHLNRAGISDLAILPIINSEYEQLQRKLVECGAPLLIETFDDIVVNAGSVTISPATVPTSSDLPSNFVEPIKLYEKANGAPDSDYKIMRERRFIPVAQQRNELIYWSWNEEEIELLGALTTRLVRIIGFKSLALLTTLQSTINVSNAKGYLAAAVASRAALTVTHNANLADQLRMVASEKLQELLNSYARKNQSLSTRRRGFRRPGG